MLKASMPLFLKSIFRNLRSELSSKESVCTGLNNLNLAISRITATKIYPGVFGSKWLEPKTSSWSERSFAKGNWYSLVRMWCVPNSVCTNERRDRHEWKVGRLYFRWPWLLLRRGEPPNSLITFTELHVQAGPVLFRFPTESILSLQPYGAAVPNFLIQYSSLCLRSGVLRLELLEGWYIFFFQYPLILSCTK